MIKLSDRIARIIKLLDGLEESIDYLPDRLQAEPLEAAREAREALIQALGEESLREDAKKEEGPDIFISELYFGNYRITAVGHSEAANTKRIRAEHLRLWRARNGLNREDLSPADRRRWQADFNRYEPHHEPANLNGPATVN